VRPSVAVLPKFGRHGAGHRLLPAAFSGEIEKLALLGPPLGLTNFCACKSREPIAIAIGPRPYGKPPVVCPPAVAIKTPAHAVGWRLARNG